MPETFKSIVWTTNVSKIMSLIILSCFFLYCLVSGIIYVFFRDKYKGIRFTTKNICYIALLSAASVTLTVLVTYFAPITVLPPIRIAFDGLMIKITGLIFGPIVGVLSGLITDMLCIMFIPSYFHIAYTLTIIFYGFTSGISYIFMRKCKNAFLLYVISSAFIAVFITFITFYVEEFPVSIFATGMESISGNSSFNHIETASKDMLALLIILSGISVFAFQTFIYIWYLLYNLKTKNNNHNNKQKIIDIDIFPVMILTVLTEYYLSSIILPWGDTALFGNKSFSVLVVYHIIEAPVKIFFNTIIIYITFRTVKPLIDRDM